MARPPRNVSALLVHVHVLGVDHLVRGAAALSATTRTSRRTTRRARALGLLAVHHLGQLVGRLGELLGRLLHLARVLALESGTRLGESLLELPLLIRTELLLVLIVGLLGVVDQT